MIRILKIVVISIFAFLLILWITLGFNTCNNKKTDNNVQTEITNDSLDNNDDLMGDDFFNEDTTGTTNEAVVSNNDEDVKSKDENQDDFIDYTGDTNESKSNVVSKPAKSSAPKPKKQSTTSSGGRYLVVAGSYLVKSNAEKMKKRLYDLGYDSEIVNFNLSQYYSVLAGRYNSNSEARNTVTILKRNGIDSYVHKKKN